MHLGHAGLIPWAIKYLPHLFPLEPAEFHWEVARLAEEYDRLALAAPRSFAKSTLLALAYPLYRASCFWEPFTLIVGDTGVQGEARTSDILSELIDNTALLQDYPHLALPNAGDYRERRVKKTTKEFVTVGGLRFTGAGAGQSLRGIRERQHRPTLIIVDDLENDESVLTEYQREKMASWFNRALLNLPGADGARIVVIGTILHPEALMATLLKPERSEIWHQRLYRAVKADGTSLWPEAWPLDKLAAKRIEIGSRAYNAEYLNDPEDDGNALFKSAHLDAGRRLAHPELTYISVSVDPSASTDGDTCGIVAGGKSEAGHAYVLEDNSVKGSPMTWARVVLETFWRLEANEVLAEKNNGGEMVLTTLKAALKPGERMPPVRLVWASRGKQTRAEPVATLAENGKIHLVGSFEKLERELTTWTPGMPSPNRLDALVWLVTGLIIDPGVGDLMLVGWAGG